MNENGRLIENEELRWMWEEAVEAYFQIGTEAFAGMD
jgi:hypothetical protein